MDYPGPRGETGRAMVTLGNVPSPARLRQGVERAAGAGLQTPDHVGGDHGGLHAGMPEQLLDLPDVGSGKQQVGGEAVARNRLTHSA